MSEMLLSADSVALYMLYDTRFACKTEPKSKYNVKKNIPDMSPAACPQGV